MDPFPPPPPGAPPPPAGPPAPSDGGPQTLHPAGPRRVKRRLIAAAIALYALSIVAASIVIMRRRAAKGQEDGQGMAGMLSLTQKETVGWLPVHGPIYHSDGGKLFEKGVELWVRRLKALSETQGVKAIVLDINSPGGSVGAVQEFHSQILRVRKEKKIPIVALFGDVAASGGYYIAVACDKIVAHPSSITGSIGVIFSHSNLEGLFEKVGYRMEPIKSGTHKDIGSPARPMTAEERGLLQALIDESYSQFTAAVREGRQVSEEQLKPWADGRIFSAGQALTARLIDAVGDSTDALELAGKLGGIAGRPKVRRDADSTRWIVEIFDSLLGGALPEAGGGLLRQAAARMGPGGLEYRWAGW